MEASKRLAGTSDSIFELLWRPGIDFKESIPLAYVGLTGRYENPVSTQFLALIYCFKIPKLVNVGKIFGLE